MPITATGLSYGTGQSPKETSKPQSVMKKSIAIIVLLSVCRLMSAQEWEVNINENNTCSLKELVTVDEGDFVIGVGAVDEMGHPNGFIVKVGKDGSHGSRKVNLPGMMLQYHTAVQLANGNYMVIGMCEDSLWNSVYPRYIRIDVFDSQLESVSSRTYSVDDDVFDCFVNGEYLPMKSTRSRQGTTLLAAVLNYYVEQPGFYRNAVRFYEFDDNGDIIRIVDNDSDVAYAASIEKITYEPHSDNLLMAVGGGFFPPNSGTPGVYVVDSNLNIVGKKSLVHVQGGVSPDLDHIDRITCDGKWMEGDCMLFDATYYLHQRMSFTYHTLYKMDSALNVHAELRLPPYDSCMYCPAGTSTAYIDDTTIFAFTGCSETMYSSFNEEQANVYLVDKHLNLLGRKTIRKDDAICSFGSPAVFSDGGCVVPFYSQNGTYYPGEPFYNAELMKFRREDIEITWDVVEEKEAKHASAYPNPTAGSISIPTGQNLPEGARLQIFDIKGMKCFDRAITGQGNLITVDVHNIQTGVYVYRVVSNGRETITGNFIKE